MERLKYRKLSSSLKKELQKQSEESYISVSPGFLAAISGVPIREVEAVWPALIKEHKLIEDMARSWTVIGKEVSDEDLDALRKRFV